MNRIISITMALILLLGTISLASNNQELAEIEKKQTVSVEEAKNYKESISKELTENDKNYQLVGIEQTENKKVLMQDKEITKTAIVPTNNKNKALEFFDSQVEINEDGYTGELRIQNDSLELQANDSHMEKYKVTISKQYNDVSENELNYIPKTIIQNGTTYYLTNPVWAVSQTKTVNGGDVPTLYNGTMIYEAVKERRVTTNYIASAKYTGTIDKEIIESVTFTAKYEEVPKAKNYTVPVVATASGIIIFSGIIILRRKNAKIYNYKKNSDYRLIKRVRIDKNNPIIDITPIRSTSNKYKIELSDSIYRELKNTNVKIKYFDRQFNYEINKKEFDINV